MIFKRSRTSTNGSGSSQNSGASIVAQEVTIEGNITAAGELHIDGTIYGSVRAKSCVIDSNGFVQGEVVAEEIFIRGRVIGPIRGVHVNLYAGAQVEGDILNDTISIENGANVYGMIGRAEGPIGDAQPAQAASIEEKTRAAASLAIAQDNFFNEPSDIAYRPLKVVKPL